MNSLDLLAIAQNKSALSKLAERFNIDLNDIPKMKKNLEKQTIEEAQRQLKAKKASWLWENSIWSGDEPVKFHFSDWDITRQSDLSKAQDVLERSKVFARELTKKAYNVVFYGNPGVGKTSLAIAILTELKNNGQSAMVINTAELSSRISNSYIADDVRTVLYEVERGAKECDVLLLDDFGTEAGSGQAMRIVRKDLQDFIYRVVNARAGKKTTIVTTNNTLQQLNAVYDRKIISRLITKDKNHEIIFSGFDDTRRV